MRTASLMLISGMLCGCAAAPVRMAQVGVPPDFSLEVRDFSPDTGALYIVEPDRWFRAAAGAEPVEQVYPPATRMLTPAQMESLWEAADAVRQHEVNDGPSAPSASLVVAMNAGGERTTVRVDPASDADAARLIERLRDLAWIGR